MVNQRFKLLAAVYLVLIKDGKILLLRRRNTGWQDGNYGLVSGHLDGNESFAAACVREAKEEAGIDIDVDTLKFVHAIHHLNKDEHQEYVVMFFTTTKWNGKITNMEPEKCDDLSWFPLDDLPDNIIPSVKQAIDSIAQQNYYSEYGWDDA